MKTASCPQEEALVSLEVKDRLQVQGRLQVQDRLQVEDRLLARLASPVSTPSPSVPAQPLNINHEILILQGGCLQKGGE